MQTLVIIGRGLIGGSIELAARGRAVAAEVVALDKGDDLGVVSRAELVVLSAPVRENIQLLSDVAGRASPTAIVTDTGSTKAEIVGAAARYPSLRFVGGHPVTGAAAGGVAAAREDLFVGRRWILTPERAADPEPVERVRSFGLSLGASVHVMEAGEHDRLFAFVSHLPQLAVSALMHVAGEGAGPKGLGLAGQGLRDTTRLAASPADIWRDIALSNASNLAAALDSLIAVLASLKDSLATDAGAIDEVFASAAKWKWKMENGKWENE